MIKFIFDLDGTITSEETLPIIASLANIEKEMASLTEKSVFGDISWKDSFVKRVELLKNIPIHDIDSLLEKTPLYKKIHTFIDINKEDCIVATGNLNCWVDKLCKRVGCAYYASEAILDGDKIVSIKNIIEKEDIVEMSQREGYKVVFVGDGNNDVNAIKRADIGIAYGATHRPAQKCIDNADHVVYTEDELHALLVLLAREYR